MRGWRGFAGGGRGELASHDAGGGALYTLTPNTVELISGFGAPPPPRRARPGPGPHTLLLRCRNGISGCVLKPVFLKAIPDKSVNLLFTDK